MSDQDIKNIAANIRRLNAAWDRRLAERRTRAQEIGKSVAEAIGADDADIRRIWGFGSTWETWRNYRTDSDIDLGLEGGDWSRAMSCLFRVHTDRDYEVSLVPLDEQPVSFSEAAKKHGVILYEKKQ